ncbi:hypothetical protein JCM19992_02750 [Thermostilla marina]
MRLEELIHTQWAADPLLAEALPVERVTTGWGHVRELPRAVVQVRRRARAWLDNTFRCAERVVLRIRIDAARCDEALDLLDRAVRSFHGKEFDLGEGMRVVRLYERRRHAARAKDGTWRAETDLAALVVESET